MRTLRLILEYDGTAYNGWQVQANHPRARTVQEVVEAGLLRLTGSRTPVRAASRTDSGVHARGQVIAFETDRDAIPMIGFTRGLGSMLPADVTVRRAEVVEDRWNPRTASRGKHYRYTYWNDCTPSALERNRTWFEPRPLDVDAMCEAAAHLVGTHDFDAFRSAGCGAKHAVRRLYRVDVMRGEYARIVLDVVGNAFVRNMVRIIAGTLRDVGVGRFSPRDVHAILESRDRTQGGMTAPSRGLCLEEVIFDERLPSRPRDEEDLEGV